MKVSGQQKNTLKDLGSGGLALGGFIPPLNNAECWGHDEALALLSRHNCPSQAWLVVGPRGVGKRTLCYAAMRRLAQGPYDKIPMSASHPIFMRMASGALPYVAIWERQSLNQQGISLEVVRSIRNFFSMTHQGPCRLLFLDNAHRLSLQAFNALLKSIEELPLKSYVFLTTLNAGLILPTVRSRCHIVTLKPANSPIFLKAIQKYDLCLPSEDLGFFQEASRGCIGMGLRMMTSFKTHNLNALALRKDFYELFRNTGNVKNYFATLLKDDMTYDIWCYFFKKFIHQNVMSTEKPESESSHLFKSRHFWQWVDVGKAVDKLIQDGLTYHMNPLHAFYELQRLCRG